MGGSYRTTQLLATIPTPITNNNRRKCEYFEQHGKRRSKARFNIMHEFVIKMANIPKIMLKLAKVNTEQ